AKTCFRSWQNLQAIPHPQFVVKCFKFSGSLARYFPGHMTNWSERLYEIFLHELKLEMESKK
uniref:Uncharacterized protein n=1 Tax=Ciona savignyi TaxID=51511 RepID=H2ZQ36_CIOSA